MGYIGLGRAKAPFDAADPGNSDVVLWNAPGGSADQDILPFKETLDLRARDATRNDAFLSGAVEARQDTVVGSQYALSAKPKYKVLGLTEEWAKEHQEEVEAIFGLHSESTRKPFDVTGHGTFTDVVRLAVNLEMVGGEFLMTSEWVDDEPGRLFSSAFRAIDPERLSTPSNMQESKLLRAGIAFSNRGRPVGYYIKNTMPGEWLTMEDTKWTYVNARTPWGRENVLHIFDRKRADQHRAVSRMVALLSEWAQTKKFRKTVLENAIVNATYAAFLESDLPSDVVFQAIGAGNMTPEETAKVIGNWSTGYLNSFNQYVGQKGHRLNGVKIPKLYPGTKFKLTPAGQGGPLGTDFEKSLLRYIAAGLGTSYEQFSKDFSGSNYASIKAVIADIYKTTLSIKRRVADAVATFMYQLWYEEMVARGEFTTLKKGAPNFWEGVNREAYTACNWRGAHRGQIEELRETQAAVLRINAKLSTREQEISRLNGGNWEEVLQQLAREEAEIRRLKLSDSAQLQNMMNAATGNDSKKTGNQKSNGESSSAASVIDEEFENA